MPFSEIVYRLSVKEDKAHISAQVYCDVLDPDYTAFIGEDLCRQIAFLDPISAYQAVERHLLRS